MTNVMLRLAQELARLARPPGSVVETALETILPTPAAQTVELARACYETFVQSPLEPDRPPGPAWDALDPAVRDSFVAIIEAKILPKARPFEAAVARLCLVMMSHRAAYMDTLSKAPRANHPLDRVRWQTELDAKQAAMSDAVEAMSDFLVRAAGFTADNLTTP